MRVTCRTVEQFLANLEMEPDVYRGTVYVSRCRRPLDGETRDSARFEVVLQASAVVNMEEGQYLLEVGERCGTDFADATQDFAGSERADELADRIKDFCKTRGLQLRPGVVSE